MKTQKKISVFIPVYNGQKYLKECIEGILSQELPKDYELELLITDSGSKDNSISIIKQYTSDSRLVFDEIPNSEFSHGGTRQRAAKRAKGEFILYISQDAIPANNMWIINMIEPFFIDSKVVCVVGKQIPRPHAPVTIKREVSSVFSSLGTDDSIVLHRYKSLIDGETIAPLNTFFSDANSAIRTDLLLNKIPLRPVNYAEDQALAEDVLNTGLIKAYSPLGSVIHSNDYNYKEYRLRKYDEYKGIQESLGIKIPIGKKKLFLGWIKPTIKDWKFVLNDNEYSLRSKIYNFILSPLFNFNGIRGGFDAFHRSDSKYSLEKNNS